MLGFSTKSQLAIEYSYRLREKSPQTWVFWIHASNAARLEQSCRDLVDQLKLEGREGPKAEMFKLLCTWLRDTREKWVLILDNIDDDRFLQETSPPLWTYIPISSNGSVLFTARDKGVATRLVEDRDAIEFKEMDEDHALAQLHNELEKETQKNDLIELAKILDFVPLAITQAAAFINNKRPRFSVAQYLASFHTDRKRTNLLEYEQPGISSRRDWEVRHSHYAYLADIICSHTRDQIVRCGFAIVLVLV